MSNQYGMSYCLHKSTFVVMATAFCSSLFCRLAQIELSLSGQRMISPPKRTPGPIISLRRVDGHNVPHFISVRCHPCTLEDQDERGREGGGEITPTVSFLLSNDALKDCFYDAQFSADIRSEMNISHSVWHPDVSWVSIITSSHISCCVCVCVCGCERERCVYCRCI